MRLILARENILIIFPVGVREGLCCGDPTSAGAQEISRSQEGMGSCKVLALHKLEQAQSGLVILTKYFTGTAGCARQTPVCNEEN